MNAKTTIRKVLFITVWLCIGAGMLTLLLAAISKKNKGQCKDYIIKIKGENDHLFIDSKDVETLLLKATQGKLKGAHIASFNLHALEQMLEHNSWINEAEIYFDNQDVLHVAVTEKEPVARIFTVAGNSFYLDSAGRKIPLSDKLSARVPVFTGFPDKKKLSAKDSVLLHEVRDAANFIINDKFWSSQVSQIDITPGGNLELVPVVGNHIIKLGNGQQLQEKFNRLKVFYNQVVRTAGFDKYKVIDVQFKGQVVASRFAGNPAVDSVQLRRNVEKLLKQSIEAESEKDMAPTPFIQPLPVDSAVTTQPVLPAETTTKPAAVITKRADKKIPGSAVSNKKDVKKKPETKKPKAVMPPKPQEEKDGGY